MKLLLLGTCCVLAVGGEEPWRETTSQAQATAYAPVPWFRHGYLITREGAGPFHAFTAFRPDGTLAYNKRVALPGGGAQASISDVDFDNEGNAAVAASATGSSGCNLHGVLMLAGTGRQTGFIDTGCFVVGHVAIAADHTIWTLGYQREAGGTSEDSQDYMIVRQFSAGGKQLGGFLPRMQFPKGLSPGSAGGDALIVASSGRIGVLACSGTSGTNREWIELDASGQVTRRVRVDGFKSGVAALTEDGHFYMPDDHNELVTIDAATHGLRKVARPGAMLMGADGNRLVYRGACCGPIQLQWFEHP